MATQSATVTERRQGESIIERACRNEGFEIFMPGYWVELKHHRTKQWFGKRFPLLTGYAFVNLPQQNFEDLRGVDGVMAVLKPGRLQQPFEFSEWAVGQLRLIEFEAKHQFQFAKARRQREEEIASQHMSRRQIKDMFPAGRRVKISDRNAVVGGLLARVVGASSQGTVKTIVETLNGMVKIDVPVEMLEDVA